MNESNQPTGQQLTPEFYAEKNWVQFKGEYYITIQDFISCMEEYAAQQTALLSEKLKAYECGGHTLIATTELAALREEIRIAKQVEAEYLTLYKELEAVKKDKEYLYNRLEETKDERDEAVKLLQEFGQIKSPCAEHDWHKRYIQFLQRLSSGETKPAEIPDSSKIEFHYLDGENPPYPEENVLWYRKGEPPYSGSMLDEDFPGLGYFFAYCDIPVPPESLTDKK